MSNTLEINPYMSLNKLINRIDIQKDAAYTTHTINEINGKELFIRCANELFIDISSYSSTYTYIQNKLHSYNYGKINTYNNYDINSYNFLPPNITHAMYDTGIKPYNINSNIKIINTPASYIDSADKIDYDEKYFF
jgi:hypothetical protein